MREAFSLIKPPGSLNLLDLRADFDLQDYGYQDKPEPWLNASKPRRFGGLPGRLFQAWLANDGNPS